MDKLKKNQILDLLEQDANILFIKIGKELIGDSAFMHHNEKELIDLARSWLKRNKQKILELICEDEKIIKLYKPLMDNTTKVQLVVAIFDLISGVLIGVSPLVVSTLLVKYGIENFCQEGYEGHEFGTNK